MFEKGSLVGIDKSGLLGKPEFNIGTLIELIEKEYGPVDREDYSAYTLTDLTNESGFYHGEEIKWAKDLRPVPKRVLLAGEDKQIAAIFRQKVLPHSEILTAGLSSEVDYEWDFTKSPPGTMEKFNLIITQAILEHLINPYGHVKDLSNHLDQGGSLIVHTHFPGFRYHRYPIDAQRFYPDWFEEISKPEHLDLVVVKRKIKEGYHLLYMLQKP